MHCDHLLENYSMSFMLVISQHSDEATGWVVWSVNPSMGT